MPKSSLLIVDDEENVRKAVARALQPGGHDFRFAASGVEALGMLREAPADLLMSDYSMPLMTGLELMRAARKMFPDMLRIILTGAADLELAMAAVNEGEVYRFLTKPWDNVELELTVRLGLERLALERENRRLLATVERQSDVLRALEAEHPGITAVRRDASGTFVLEDDEVLEPLTAALQARTRGR
jgi:DNA-binding NtrC family response regulator